MPSHDGGTTPAAPAEGAVHTAPPEGPVHTAPPEGPAHTAPEGPVHTAPAHAAAAPPAPRSWLTGRLAALARAAGPARPAGSARQPAHGPRQDPVVLADRPDATVVGLGGVVAKAHAPGTDAAELAARLRVAAHPLLAGVLLPPVPPVPPPRGAGPGAAGAPLTAGGRLVTLWPRGSAVDPDDPAAAPWQEAGALLGRLHAVPPAALAPLTGPLPAMGGPLKALRAVRRMRAALASGAPGAAGPHPAPPPGADAALRAAAGQVARAWAALPAWCRAEEPPPPARAGSLCHGDFHLGQLVRHPPGGGAWRLIDVDDLGTGDAAWDLARPAAWYATGLLPPAAWQGFLDAYQSALGRPAGDPWARLDVPARAVTVQLAALAIARAYRAGRPLDEAEQACADACGRIAAQPVTDPERERELPREPGP